MKNLYVGTAQTPTGHNIASLISANSLAEAETYMDQHHPGAWLFLYLLTEWINTP